ncbi:uncharacterized protein THITE_2143847 [Thermothielavioides terrestris NRRL 8126]|uniref:NADPH-dependent FMN reductase-like domain-containing protein n=1 Tax=Thermothielavioides terrestris (strain ATCC 38088 / NRRL 8126) TaxID=578455 RepID=G2QYQ2_THETT|nr:uncharacterized protein THITE_2143847 [Thermothielavioides terrestris NRRL 8126]AEO66244.1 hypothetical protein THITE_2143847 [Thermothielavioides terrestris NRRL 8126]
MATDKAFKVGIIIGSRRVVRVGPQIASFVHDIIKNAEEKAASPRRTVTFDVVDLKAVDLPFFDEPGIPQRIQSADGYAHEHTRAWSRRVAALDAFVFVTPQRNWSFPAELKNALDFLFHEWAGKPAMIVSYGGHGGHQCAEQLRAVLRAMRVRVTEKSVGFAFPDPDFRTKCFNGQELGLDASNDAGPWAAQRSEVVSAWDELLIPEY